MLTRPLDNGLFGLGCCFLMMGDISGHLCSPLLPLMCLMQRLVYASLCFVKLDINQDCLCSVWIQMDDSTLQGEVMESLEYGNTLLSPQTNLTQMQKNYRNSMDTLKRSKVSLEALSEVKKSSSRYKDPFQSTYQHRS